MPSVQLIAWNLAIEFQGSIGLARSPIPSSFSAHLPDTYFIVIFVQSPACNLPIKDKL